MLIPNLHVAHAVRSISRISSSLDVFLDEGDLAVLLVKLVVEHVELVLEHEHLLELMNELAPLGQTLDHGHVSLLREIFQSDHSLEVVSEVDMCSRYLPVKIAQIASVVLVNVFISLVVHLLEHTVDLFVEHVLQLLLTDYLCPSCLLKVLILGLMANLVELETSDVDCVLILETIARCQQEVARVLYLCRV